MQGSTTRSGALAFLIGIAVAACVSCSGGSDSDDESTGSGGSAGSKSNPGIDVGGGARGPKPGTGNSECTPGPDEQGCVGTAYEGENIPLDIYVMFDLSCSMSCSVDKSGCCRLDSPVPLEQWRLQPVRQAIREFLLDPASVGIGVGLGYFGDHDRSLDNDPEVCTVESHTDATVEIERLPGVAHKIIAELEQALPQGGTETHLAIEGACEYVKGWKEKNPGHKVVILLVTDGIPERACGANIERATAAARDCYADGAGFETYVLGVVANNSNSLQQLNSIAQAGGTEHAYLTNTDDVAGSVLAALNAIRGDAVIPCDLQLPKPPQGETLNTSLVNLGICDAGGTAQVTPYVESASECDGPGWYYDDPESPAMIHLCEATCETVSVPGASLFFSLGCATQTPVF
jgi:hypothetical protein